MDNDNNIYDFDPNLICEFFLGAQRQGPGSPATTLQALSFINNLTAHSHIVDLGCGTGSQTLVLANNTPSAITAIDIFPGFIEKLNLTMDRQKLNHRVKGIVGSMDNLPFEPNTIDLIWSEGAIYNIGFERGLSEWRQFLKTGGYVAVSESSWFTNSRPSEIEDFWMECYPEMDTIPNKVSQMERAGYKIQALFVLPENCWTSHYYNPLELTKHNFLEQHRGNIMAQKFIDMLNYEVSMYQQYKSYYGYVFYIGQKF